MFKYVYVMLICVIILLLIIYGMLMVIDNGINSLMKDLEQLKDVLKNKED